MAAIPWRSQNNNGLPLPKEGLKGREGPEPSKLRWGHGDIGRGGGRPVVKLGKETKSSEPQSNAPTNKLFYSLS
ncbi:hypothetical protein Y1Q_0015530 [Alligator mississippiensis]|uniref:Uncharacterized protein n=1 Tax=Alligator mississippiensis TaxID=8496 RepID=A0A151NP67_ALLMI|nr:hypothetical protein Y1Q_0015530 [Alligator mississippiensis]